MQPEHLEHTLLLKCSIVGFRKTIISCLSLLVAFMDYLSLSRPINALSNSLLLHLPSLGNLTHIVGFKNLKHGDNALNSSSSPDL